MREESPPQGASADAMAPSGDPSAVRRGRGGIPLPESPKESLARAANAAKAGVLSPSSDSPSNLMRTPVGRVKAMSSVDASPTSSTKGTPRTPLNVLSGSPNVVPPSTGGGANALLYSPFPGGEISNGASPAWNVADRTPGLSDSLVSEQANFLVDAIANEPADEEIIRELKSALKARQENEALRDHIEHLKNGEIDMGLEASKRMTELSSEYMEQVDRLTKEKDAVRARAEAAEAEAKKLANMMRAHGFGTPLPSTSTRRPPTPSARAAAAGAGATPTNVGVSPGGGDPAAWLFNSPAPNGLPLDCLNTPQGFGETFAIDPAADAGVGARQNAAATPESAPRSGSHALAVPMTPSGDAAEGAARVAMAGMDHPTLIREASNLVAANVRLERERRALAERLASLMKRSPGRGSKGAIPGTPIHVQTVTKAVNPFKNAGYSPSPLGATFALTPVAGAGAGAGAGDESATAAAVDGTPELGWRSVASSPADIDVMVDVPDAPPSWDMCGTAFAVAQLSAAIERSQSAANEAAASLEAMRAMDEDDQGGKRKGKTWEETRATKRKEAHAAALEAVQAAALASMQREHLAEVLKVERDKAKSDAASSFASMQRELARNAGSSSPATTSAATPANETAVSIGDAIVTPVADTAEASTSTGPTAEELAAAKRAEAAESEVSELRRKLSAAAAAADKERAELQYAAAAHERDAKRLATELEAATTAAENAHELVDRAQRRAAVVEAKHTRLSIELSAALQKLRETEFEARAETRKLSLSFKLDQRRASGSGGALSDSPLAGPDAGNAADAMDVISPPPTLARVNTSTPSPCDNSSDAGESPSLIALADKVCSTRTSLAAALKAAEDAAESTDDGDETVESAAAMVKDLRAQLEASRAETSDAIARLEAAETAVASATLAVADAEAKAAAAIAEAEAAAADAAAAAHSPSPSPIAARKDSIDASKIDEVGDALGMENASNEPAPESEARRKDLAELRESAAAAEAALTWARRAEAAAHGEAETERQKTAAARAETASALASLESARAELVEARAATTAANEKLAEVSNDANQLADVTEGLRAEIDDAHAKEAALVGRIEELQDVLAAAAKAAADERAAAEATLAIEKEALEKAKLELVASAEKARSLAARIEGLETSEAAMRSTVEEKETALREATEENARCVARLAEQQAAVDAAAAAAAERAAAASSADADANAERERLTIELELACVKLETARAETEKIQHGMREWKESQSQAVEKWVEDAKRRTETAETAAAAATKRAAAAEAAAAAALAEKENAEKVVAAATAASFAAVNPAQVEALVAENKELVKEAEANASKFEKLEEEREVLRERCEAAETAAADAPHLRAENYDLAVKHRGGLQRLHEELAARRALEERVDGYEHATKRLEGMVAELEVALREAREMCVAAKTASHAAAAERAASDAAKEARTPTKGDFSRGPSPGSSGGSSSSPASDAVESVAAAAAADAAKGAMRDAVEAAEREASAAREDAATARAALSAMKMEMESLRAALDSRRSDLGATRSECESLRWKVLEMEEDARVSPSPRKPIPSDSPFASARTFSRFGKEAAETAAAAAASPAAVAVGGKILALTPPAAETETAAADATATASAKDKLERLEADVAAARAKLADRDVALAKAITEITRLKATRVSKARAEHLTQAKTAAEEEVAAKIAELTSERRKVRDLLAGKRKLEEAATEADAARERAEFSAAEAIAEVAAAREAAETSKAAQAAAEATAARYAHCAAAAETAFIDVPPIDLNSPTPPSLDFLSPVKLAPVKTVEPSNPSTEDATTNTTPKKIPAPPAPVRIRVDAEVDTGVVSPAGGKKFAAALMAYTSRLRDDVSKAEAEAEAHKAHAERMRNEIARLAKDLPSKHGKGKTGGETAAESDAVVVAAKASAAKLETKAVYYKTIAKKCYHRMKKQKEAYELQIEGLRKELEVHNHSAVAETDLSLASTAVGGPSPGRVIPRRSQFR